VHQQVDDLGTPCGNRRFKRGRTLDREDAWAQLVLAIRIVAAFDQPRDFSLVPQRRSFRECQGATLPECRCKPEHGRAKHRAAETHGD
jgi:hypothetical protein